MTCYSWSLRPCCLAVERQKRRVTAKNNSAACWFLPWTELAGVLKRAIHYFPAEVDYSSALLFDIYRMHFIIGTDLEINGGFSVPGLQPRHPTTTSTAAATPSAMLGSPKHWPSPHLPPDLLVLHYLMHTNPTQTVAEFWGKVLTETYGCWWITCIIEGYENRLYPPRLSRVTHRHRPWSPASTAVEGVLSLNEQHTHYSTFSSPAVWKALC